MSDEDLIKEALRGLAAAGPLALVLGYIARVLWQRLREREQQIDTLLREVLAALAGNTAAQAKQAEAIEGLKDAIEDRRRG